MKLAIDVGNTLTKTAVFQDNDLLRLSFFKDFTLEELKRFINESETKSNRINYSIISSVRKYDSEIENYLNKNYRFTELSSKIPLPVNIRYRTSETLGNDRIAGVCGASAMFPGENILVIDAGTCVTYDFIDNEKNYFGGAISPGIDIRFKALNTFTGNLPLVNRAENFDLIGDSTEESIKSGVLNGIIAEIEGVIKRYKDRFGQLKIIFTGGDTIFFDKRLKNDIFAVPNLVLNGLNEILDFNINKDIDIL
jgi:type III pantothenate kinase